MPDIAPTPKKRSNSFQRRVYQSALFRRSTTLVAGGYRRLFERRANDQSAMLQSGSALVVAPHPDDETLGCGGTIAAKVEAGHEVHIAVVTDGRASHTSSLISPDELAARRSSEVMLAAVRLGVPEDRVHQLGFVDGQAEQAEVEIAKALTELTRSLQPDQVLIPSATDANRDHRAVNRAALAAVDAAGSGAAVFEYLIWFWQPAAWVDLDAPALRKTFQLFWRPVRGLARFDVVTSDISTHQLRKRHALAAHATQMENVTGEPDWRVIPEDTVIRLTQAVEHFVAAGLPAWGRTAGDVVTSDGRVDNNSEGVTAWVR